MNKPLAAALLLYVAAAQAQDAPKPLRIEPQEGATYTFVIDRRTTIREVPGESFDPPRKRKVTSTVHVQPRATEAHTNVLLDVEFLRVNGFETGADPTRDATFDRKRGDAPSGRPETLIVGRTVTIEARRDGTFVDVRGVDEAMPGNALAATAVIADLRALIAQLPPANMDGNTWRSDALEGRAFLRARVESTHTLGTVSEGEAAITVKGTLAAAPEGAGEAFASTFGVTRGERSARYRVSRLDGLPIAGRATTRYAVHARLTGSDMEARVDTDTVVNVRRVDSPDDPASAGIADPPAPRPGDGTPNRGLPGWLGTKRDALHRLAGPPTITSDDVADGKVDRFEELALDYEYDDDGFVRRVTAFAAPGGGSFAGKVLGLGIGDMLADAERLWGDAGLTTSEDGAALHTVEWAFDRLLIEVEAWASGGTDAAGVVHAAGQVRRIRVTARANR